MAVSNPIGAVRGALGLLENTGPYLSNALWLLGDKPSGKIGLLLLHCVGRQSAVSCCFVAGSKSSTTVAPSLCPRAACPGNAGRGSAVCAMQGKPKQCRRPDSAIPPEIPDT